MVPRRLPQLLLLVLLLSLAFGRYPTRRRERRAKPIACRKGELEYRHRGDIFCYRLTRKFTFKHALAVCRVWGGRLATIYSQQHNDLLYGWLTESTYIGAVARGNAERHPLGDVGPGVVWSWMSGQPPGYTNVLQNETRGFRKQPDGGGFEGCMEIMKHPVSATNPGNGHWGDTDCRALKPALCARRLNYTRPVTSGRRVVPWRFDLQRNRRAACPAGFLRVGVKRFGERDSRSTCLSKRQTAANFSAALQRCHQLDPTSTTARPARLAGRRRWLPAYGGGEKALLWSGADRRNMRLQWRWQDDGREVWYRPWTAGQPRDEAGANCAAYDPARRGMVATSCDAKLEFLCESPPHGCPTDFRVSATGLRCLRSGPQRCGGSEEYFRRPRRNACTARLCPLRCPTGYSQLGLKCLQINDTISWSTDVAATCLMRQTFIMKSSSREENELMRRQTVRTGRPLWLRRNSGWQSFSSWHSYAALGLPKEPNEPTRGVHTTCDIIWFDGEWMDVDCLEEFSHICEKQMEWKDCADAVKKIKAT